VPSPNRFHSTTKLQQVAKTPSEASCGSLRLVAASCDLKKKYFSKPKPNNQQPIQSNSKQFKGIQSNSKEFKAIQT
jgi:hypothetical protein